MIFVLPEITDDTAAFVHSVSWNEIYIMLFFFGLTVGVFQDARTKLASLAMMWVSLLIPVFSLFRYRQQNSEIVSDSVENLKRGRGSKWMDNQFHDSSSKNGTNNPLATKTNKSGSEVPSSTAAHHHHHHLPPTTAAVVAAVTTTTTTSPKHAHTVG